MTPPATTPNSVQVFRYLPELDAFVCTDLYTRVATELGLVEWSPVVWIGRLFCLDSDYGEHWFDNWDLRDAVAFRVRASDLDPEDLLILDPERFQNGVDGPCHTPALRKAFWTDVLLSLKLSWRTIVAEARFTNELNRQLSEREPDLSEYYIEDLELRIANLQAELARSAPPTDA